MTWIFYMPAILWYILSAKYVKGIYCIFIFLASTFFVCEWFCDHKKNSIISWSIFKEEFISHHVDLMSNSFFFGMRCGRPTTNFSYHATRKTLFVYFSNFENSTLGDSTSFYSFGRTCLTPTRKVKFRQVRLDQNTSTTS